MPRVVGGSLLTAGAVRSPSLSTKGLFFFLFLFFFFFAVLVERDVRLSVLPLFFRVGLLCSTYFALLCYAAIYV